MTTEQWLAPEKIWVRDQFPRDFVGYGVECGAWDGQQGSVTLELEFAGWTILCVEPNPECEAGLKQWRNRYVMAAASDHDSEAETLHVHTPGPGGYTSLRPTYHPVWHPNPDAKWDTVQVKVRTLNRLLAEAGFPRLDLAVIDTEGTELDVLKGLDFAIFRPKAMVVESWDEDTEMRRYVISKGYRFIGRSSVNDCFRDAR